MQLEQDINRAIQMIKNVIHLQFYHCFSILLRLAMVVSLYWSVKLKCPYWKILEHVIVMLMFLKYFYHKKSTSDTEKNFL